MSSHWDYVENLIVDHDALKPFAPENGKSLKYAIGQRVIYTNDYGVSFCFEITDFFKRATDPGLYAAGYRYLVNSSSCWMPIKELSLSIASAELENRLIN
jgi:hypothetical protein